MIKEILYTTAIDKNGNLIQIDTAKKGMDYYCPLCKKEFILRKSGKTGKGSKRPHFAHNELTTNCTPESVLHYSFKKLLINLLEENRAENKRLNLNWNCNSCNYQNSGNLLDKVTFIKEEYNLGQCRPDIALLDDEENTIAVIEIVVKHKPEESVLQFYRDRKITLIQIDLSSEEDLERIEEKITNPNIVDFCLSPTCQNNNRYEISRKIIYPIVQCNQCFSRKEEYLIEIESIFGKQHSYNFTESEISFIKSKRKNIIIKNNKATNEKYPIADCVYCKRSRSRSRSSRRF